MDFGKLPNLSRLATMDFSLPAIAPTQEARNARVLGRAGALGLEMGPGLRCAENAQVYVGCPIWAEKRWTGMIYPLGTRSADYLFHYSRQFNTIELNVTHYKIPTLEAVDEWRAATPSGFKFCPKFPQVISHDHGLVRCEPLTLLFVEAMLRLEDRLGTTFLQLPPGFHPGMLPVLKRFLEGLPVGFPVCVEFRHPGWFKDGGLLPGALDVLERVGAGTVITDVAGRRDVLHFSLSAPRLVMRLIGNTEYGAGGVGLGAGGVGLGAGGVGLGAGGVGLGAGGGVHADGEGLHPTDVTRLAEWTPRIEHWLGQGLREFYFMAHEPDNFASPWLAREFVRRINRAAPARGRALVRDWEPMDQGTQLGLL